MSTTLWIETVKGKESERIHSDIHETFLELSEDFLFDLFSNEELLKLYLSIDEIRCIRPNWGEVQINTTDSLEKNDKEEYIALLQETMASNSSKNLDKFLKGKGIRSDKIRDRAKSAKDVLKVIRKLISGLGYNHMIVIKFREEIDRLLDFLSKKSRKAEQIFIEFKD
mgnify:CR=1 FL=1